MFKPVKTDDGFCCSFNTLSLSEGFVKVAGSEQVGDDDFDENDSYGHLDDDDDEEEEEEKDESESEEQKETKEAENGNENCSNNDYREEW